MNGTQITQGILASIVILGLIVLGMWGCPQYNIYRMRANGQAALAHAQFQKEVKVAEAKAKMESAAYLSAADTLRAHGTARANEIIGSSITDQYLKWMWTNELSQTKNQIIYVPSGGYGLPIQEATRLNTKP